jgi:hypothetical protein
MSDFIADLERELLAAARRRATRRRRVVLLPRLRPATVLAFVALAALVVALFAVARGLDGGSHPADERPQPPPPSGPAFALPAAAVAKPCPGVEQREYDGGIQHPMSVFDRPRTDADAVPALDGADSFSWIPAGTIHRPDARRAAPDQFDAQVYLVPAAEPRKGGACNGHREAVMAVCLVVVDDETFVRCFSELEIEGGRAVAVTPAGVAYGVVPNRVGRVTLENVTADVHDNAFEVPIAAQAGDEIRMQLEWLDACRPSRALLSAVPVLERGSLMRLPLAAEDALPSGGLEQWAVAIPSPGELELWAVARCDDAESACVLGIYDDQWVAQPCATARQIRSRRENWWMFPAGGRLGIAGIAPPGSTRVEVLDGDDVHEVPLTGGVFGGLLPASYGASVDPGERDPSERLVVRIR